MQSKEHWEKIYSTKYADAVSWFQPHAERSLRLIRNTGIPHDARIIDVGGGASILLDELVEDGFSNLSVLDLSANAVALARNRLGEKASHVVWIEGNVTTVDLPGHFYDLWHDRAAFHFLASADDRALYVQTVLHAVKPGGHVIVATFAKDGPTECSGLPVNRYSTDELHAEFGAPFTLVQHEREAHETPFGTVQQFVYCYCRK